MSRAVPDEVILGLLKVEPTHGYDLLARFRSQSELGRVWRMSTSQLYAVLKRLESQDLIVGREVEDPQAPVRIEYSLTDSGDKKLDAWLKDPHPSVSIHRIRLQFISRLYIASLLGIKPDEIIEHQREACAKQCQKLTKERRQSTSSVEKLTLDYVIGQLRSAMDWLEDIKDSDLAKA